MSKAGNLWEKQGGVVKCDVSQAFVETFKCFECMKRRSFAVDAVMIFKIIVLQILYNLHHDQDGFQISDRFSFLRFLKIGLEDKV